jgi:nucleotidyltransferase/DNA polymerase involved in DNA repair
MGEPYFRLRKMIDDNGVAVFSANFVLYGDMSRRVMSLLAKAVPATEIYSIDEAFLDFSGMGTGDLRERGLEISHTIYRYTGIPVSIGIAPTKTLAKIASKLCKRYPKLDGCCYMHRAQDIEKVLRRFPIEDVWGIGRKWSRMLVGQGVRTARDFTRMPQVWVRKNMSVVGLRIWKELHGEPCIAFEQMPTDKKQIATTRSFDRDISDLSELHKRIAQFAAACAEKLRAQKSVCGEVTVFIYTNRFREDAPQHYESRVLKLSEPTDSTTELVSYASELLRSAFRKGYAYKRGGVIVSDIRSKSGLQGVLFGNADRSRQNLLMKTVDSLNAHYGRHKVATAAEGFDHFKMNRNHLSRKFTTDWNDIIKVKV